MSKKLSNFNYEIVDSKIKNHHEIKVTYDYKGKQINYFVFVENKANYNNNDYIKAAKQKINQEVESNKLTKYARHYLHPFTFCKPTQIAIAALGATTIAFAALFCYKMLYHEPVEPITSYLVTWDLGNNKTLVENYPIGAIPDYKGMKPTIPDDTEIDSEGELYHYEFNGWDRPFAPVTEDTTYHAQFEKISMVTKITIDIDESELSNEIGINMHGGADIDAISWGDGSDLDTENLTKFYDSPGVYTIKVYGRTPNFSFTYDTTNNATKLSLGWGITKINNGFFCGLGYYQNDYFDIEIPGSVTDIDSSVVDFTSKITSFYIPNSVVNINDSAFGGTLEKIVFQDNSQLKLISSNIASACNNLHYIDFGNDSQIQTIKENAFSNDPLYYVKIPNTVKKIENQAFNSIPNFPCLLDFSDFSLSQLNNLSTINDITSDERAALVADESMITDSIKQKFDSYILLAHKCNVVSNKYKVEYPKSAVGVKPKAETKPSNICYSNIITSISNPDEHPTQDKIHAYVGDEDISNLIEYYHDPLPGPGPQSTPAGYLKIHSNDKVTGDITLVIDD